MQLPFFFEEDITVNSDTFEVSKETAKHLVQVLRKQRGDRLIITDGAGVELTCEITEADKKHTLVKVVDKIKHNPPKNQNTIAIALIKNLNRFEWFLEKATELGIKSIYLLTTERTERKTIRMDKVRATLISALIQSQQFYLPKITEPLMLKEIVRQHFDQKLIAHCLPVDNKPELETIIDRRGSNIVLIGPEGDFTEHEIDLCIDNGYSAVSLGKTRLRTETAALKAAVLLS